MLEVKVVISMETGFYERIDKLIEVITALAKVKGIEDAITNIVGEVGQCKNVETTKSSDDKEIIAETDKVIEKEVAVTVTDTVEDNNAVVYEESEVRKELLELRNKHGKEAAKTALEHIGFSKLSEVPAEYYSELMAKIKEMM